MSQAEVASKASITQSALSQIENGNRMPSLIVLKKLSKVLNQTVEDILGEAANVDEDSQHKAFYKKYEVLSELSTKDQDAIISMAKHLAKKNT